MDIERDRIKRTGIAFLVFLIVSLGVFLSMKFLLNPLTSKDIINLEIARTTNRLVYLLNLFRDSSPSKFEKLPLSISLDFLFIISYTGLIITASRFFGYLSGNDLIERASRFFLFIAIAAGLADVIENLLLLQTIHREMSELVVRMTYNMAVAKFSMIIISVMFIGIELVFVAGSNMSKHKYLGFPK